MKYNVVLTFLRSFTRGDWYVDSGSLHHMTGEWSFLSNLKPVSAGKVMFGDGAIGKIIK